MGRTNQIKQNKAIRASLEQTIDTMTMVYLQRNMIIYSRSQYT